MVRILRGCCGCDAQNTACCISCSERESVEMTCDRCKDDVFRLFWFGDEQLCVDCLLKEFDEVEVD